MFAFLWGWFFWCGQAPIMEMMPPHIGEEQAPLENRLGLADCVVLAWAERAAGNSAVTLHVRQQWKAKASPRILVKLGKYSLTNRRQLGLAFLFKDHGPWEFLPANRSWIPLNEAQAYVYSRAIEAWQRWRHLKNQKVQREYRLRWLVQLADSPVTLVEVATFFRQNSALLLELDKSQRETLLRVCSQKIATSPPDLLDLLLALNSIPAFGRTGVIHRTLSLLHHATQTPQPYLAEDHWLRHRQKDILAWADFASIAKPFRPMPPGYGGTFCSAAAAKVLGALRGKNLAQPAQDWQLVSLSLTSPTPHFFSGKRGGKGKGPHAVLSSGKEKYVFPVETDGDAAVLAFAMTNKTALQLKGIISPALYRALKADPLPGF
jgi:hypothetical protein